MAIPDTQRLLTLAQAQLVEGPPGAPGGSDAATAGWIETPGSDTAAALTAAFAKRVSLVVDAAGGGDYTTVLAATTQAGVLGGADILVKRGTYAGGFVIPTKTTLRGEGSASVIRLANGANTNTISTAGGSVGVIIENLYIDGNKANNTLASGSTVAIFGSKTMVRNCRIVDSAGYGLVVYGPGTGGSASGADCIFEGNSIEDPAKDGIEIQAASRVTVTGNLVRGSGDAGIYVWANTGSSGACSNVTVSGNTVLGYGSRIAGTGIRVDDGATDVTVSGNVVGDATKANSYGIGVFSQISNVARVSVTGNTVTGTHLIAGVYVGKAERVAISGNVIDNVTGINIQAVSTVTQLAISDNVVTRCTSAGINVAGVPGVVVESNVADSCGSNASPGIEINGCLDATINGNRVSLSGGYGLLFTGCTGGAISGNTCYLNGYAGISIYNSVHGSVVGNVCRSNGTAGVVPYGIFVYRGSTTAGWIISANRCYDTQGAKTQTYGLLVSGACDDLMIGPNLLSGNLTGAQSVDGAATNVKTVTPV